MRICKNCLYSSFHPLNLTFNSHGVCSGCFIHEEKDQLDWKERENRLENILKQYRNASNTNYDCIVPVSGARDSYFIVHMIKNVYKMNPMLVTYNKHYNTSVGVRNLANLRSRFDCDIMTLTVNPQTVKKITRATFRRLGSIYWHCIAGQTVYPVQTAVKFKIPLIIWGAHQGIDQVGMFSHEDEVEMTRKYRKEHDLLGFEADDLISEFDGINESDIYPFQYPDNKEIEQVGVRGIYLNNYIRWDSRTQHEKMIRDFGYESSFLTRTFDYYNDVDCWNYSDVHDYIKYAKHCYTKVMDHACREIRLKRMTRNEGIEQVLKLSPNAPQNLNMFLNWIGMTKNSFEYILDQHRNLVFWRRNSDWEWELTQIGQIVGLEQNSPMDDIGINAISSHREFQITAQGKSTDDIDRYLLVGKGLL